MSLNDILRNSTDTLQQNLEMHQAVTDAATFSQKLTGVQTYVSQVRKQITFCRDARATLAPSCGLTEEQLLNIGGILGQLRSDIENHIDPDEDIRKLKSSYDEIRQQETEKWRSATETKANNILNMLNNMVGILGEPAKTQQLISQLKKGIKAECPTLDEINAWIDAMKTSEEMIHQSGITPEIQTFLSKALDGKATLYDLSPTIISWFDKHKLSQKIKISLS